MKTIELWILKLQKVADAPRTSPNVRAVLMRDIQGYKDAWDRKQAEVR